MDQNTVKLVAGVLALVLVAIIVIRRKRKKGVEDEF
jgi:LPXTG-motif cell wall-anchored protein